MNSQVITDRMIEDALGYEPPYYEDTEDEEDEQLPIRG